jgi:hypothetical protein
VRVIGPSSGVWEGGQVLPGEEKVTRSRAAGAAAVDWFGAERRALEQRG